MHRLYLAAVVLTIIVAASFVSPAFAADTKGQEQPAQRHRGDARGHRRHQRRHR